MLRTPSTGSTRSTIPEASVVWGDVEHRASSSSASGALLDPKKAVCIPKPVGPRTAAPRPTPRVLLVQAPCATAEVVRVVPVVQVPASEIVATTVAGVAKVTVSPAPSPRPPRSPRPQFVRRALPGCEKAYSGWRVAQSTDGVTLRLPQSVDVTLRCSPFVLGGGRQPYLVSLPSDTTFGALKESAAQLLGLPIPFQKLVVGCGPGSVQAVPCDDEPLSAYCSILGGLSVTVLMMMDQVLQDLAELGVGLRRRRALAALASLGRDVVIWGGGEAEEALLALSWDGSALIRQAAALVYPRVFVAGDARAAGSLKRLLGDADEAVRRSAWEAFLKVAASYSEVVECFCEQLDSPRADIALSTMEVLIKHCAQESDRRVGLLILRCLCHSDKIVRKRALWMLPSVAERGYPETFDVLWQLLVFGTVDIQVVLSDAAPAIQRVLVHLRSRDRSQDASVRVAALEALCIIVRKGETAAIDGLCANLVHDDPLRRKTALDVLCKLVAKEDKTLLPHSAEHVQDGGASALAAADPATATEPWTGSAVALQLIAENLLHCQAGVRQAATRALRHLATPGQQAVILAACRGLEDTSPEFREVALTALVEFTERGDELVTSELVALSSSSDPGVRRTALRGLRQVAAHGNERAVAVALERLEDRDVGVRRTATELLGDIAEKGDASVVQEVVAKLDKWDPDLRCTAVQALTIVATPDDAKALEALSLRMTQELNEGVRQAAFAAIELLARGAAQARDEHAPKGASGPSVGRLGATACAADDRTR